MRRLLVGFSQALAFVMIPIMLVSIWLDVQALNTTRYANAMLDLGGQRGFQQEFANQITRMLKNEIALHWNIVASTEIPEYIDQLGGIEAVYAEIESAVGDLVESEEFPRVWADANRLLHQQVKAFLRGDDSALIVSDGRKGIALNLETVAAWLDPYTDDSMSEVLTFALEDGSEPIHVAQSQSFPPLEWLARNSGWVAIGSVALFLALQAGAVFLARNRRRQVAIAALGATFVAMATVAVTRTILSDYLARITNAEGRDLAQRYIEAVLSDFATAASIVAIAGAAVVLIILLAPVVRRPAPGDPRTAIQAS